MRIRPWLHRTLSITIYIVAVVAVLSYVRSPLAFERHHIGGALGVGSLICFGFGAVGIYTGTVSSPRPRGRSLYAVPVRKDDDPLGFWISVGVYLGGGVAFLYWAIRFLA